MLAFIQRGVDREPEQETFVEEVRNWTGGIYTADFSTVDDLRDAVILGLHDLAVRNAAGSVDEEDLMERANALQRSDRFNSQSSLTIVVVGGPCQSVLRPAQLEDRVLHEKIQKEALFGASSILDRAQGTSFRRDGRAIILDQARASVLLDELGSIRVIQSVGVSERRAGMVQLALIEEDVRDQIISALRFAVWLLDEVDGPRRLSHVLPVASLAHVRHLGWLTRAEYAAHPTSFRLSLTAPERIVHPVPNALPRGTITAAAAEIAEDLTVLFRREMQRL